MTKKGKFILGCLLCFFQFTYAQDTNNVFYVVMDKLAANNTFNYLESEFDSINGNKCYYFGDVKKDNITATNTTEFEIAKKYYASRFPSRPDFSIDALKFTKYLDKTDDFKLSNNKPTFYHFLFCESDLEIYDYEKLILRRFLIINNLTNEKGLKSGIKVIVHLTGENKENILKFKSKYEGYGYEVQSY